MSIYLPEDIYRQLVKPPNTLKGIFAWNGEGACLGGGGCVYCDYYSNQHPFRCKTLITDLMTSNDLSPSQAFIYTDNQFKIIQIDDYPEYFI